jgi:hypothetical protein
MPAVIGLRRPVLLVPPDFEPDAPGARAVIGHELAHIRRRDLLVAMVARLTLVIQWWHPCAWLVARGIAGSAEEACDDWAVTLVRERRAYAECLLRWAERAAPLQGFGCARKGRALVRRVERTLTGPPRPALHVPGPTRVAIAACVLLAGSALGMMRVEPAAGQAPNVAEPPITPAAFAAWHCSPVQAAHRLGKPYGYHVHPILKRRSFHAGVDLFCPSGTTIRAVTGGRVSHAGWYGAYGHAVLVDHAGGWSTLYAHCSRVVVADRETVEPGQRLGYVGQTGWATAPHLHFELRRDDKPVDPQDHAMPGL